MGKYIDLTGQKYGKLTCIKDVGRQGKQTLWLCVCECGEERVTTSGRLRSGRSFECLKCVSSNKKANYNTKTRLYKIWIGMKQRCSNPNRKRYERYGGRGIAVCAEWENDYPAFEKWSLENGYNDTLTIDRKNNDLGYCGENCAWVTKKEQNRNYSRNVWIEYNGKRQIMADWSKELGIPQETLKYRFEKSWSVERILTPAQK